MRNFLWITRNCPEEYGQSAPLDGRVEDLSEDEEEKRAS